MEANLEEAEERLGRANNKNISVVRELAHHLRWKASKLKPRNYGDRVQAEVSGPDGGPVAFALTPMGLGCAHPQGHGQEPTAPGGCPE